MKFNKLLMGIMGLLALSSCSSSDDVTPTDRPGSDGEPRFMSVAIRNAHGNTRAGGDQSTDTNGNTFEEGYESENNISSLRFYFFDANGSPVAIQSNGRSYYETDPDDITAGSANNSPSVEKVLNVLIVFNNSESQVGTTVKKMLAVANYESIRAKLGDANLSLARLQEIVGSEAELNINNPAAGFVMTNSSYVNAAGQPVCTTELSEVNIKDSKELATQDPVDVYVERVAAKVRVKAAWDASMTTLPVKFNGKDCTAIKLSSKFADGTTSDITDNNKTDGNQVYVIFNGWNLWWNADRSYLVKKVDNWQNTLGWNWNDMAYFRSYWAENPKDVVLGKYRHDAATKEIIAGNGQFTESNVPSTVVYCLENAAAPEAHGFMPVYNPNSETTPRSLVYLAATLVTVSNGVATELEIAEWASKRGPVADIMDQVFKVNENIFYFRATDGRTMIPVRTSDLRLVTGMQAGVAVDNIENSPRYLSYLNLKENGLYGEKDWNGAKYAVEGQLYLKEADGNFTATTADAVNSKLESAGGIKVWKDGNVYYYHEINHLAPNDAQYVQKGQYGVVRNHIYEVILSNVYGLGTPVLTPEGGEYPDDWELIVPQKPTNDMYLGARVNILSWRVVPNNVRLDW